MEWSVLHYVTAFGSVTPLLQLYHFKSHGFGPALERVQIFSQLDGVKIEF